MISLMCRYRERFHRAEEGLSLIEVMISLFILSVSIAAVASVAATSLRSNRISRDRQVATNLASSLIEQTRAIDDYDTVAYATGATPTNADPFVDGGEFDHDRDGTGEPFIESATGTITNHVETNGRFTVRRFLTWYEDPNLPGSENTKRITVVVTWSDVAFGGGEVRESTLLAEARRGLPAPAFDVSPDNSSATVSSNVANFSLALSNLGERDSYSFSACPRSGSLPSGCLGGSDVTSVLPSNNHVKVSITGTGSWDISVRLNTELMADSTGDNVPDSMNPVDRDVTQPLEITVTQISGVDNYAKTIELIFRSAFDATVDDSITLCIEKGAPSTPCPSVGPTASPTPTATVALPGDKTFYLEYDSTRAGADDRVFDMETAAPTATTLTDYDIDSYDGDSFPGMRQEKGKNDIEVNDPFNGTIEWDWQNTGTTKIELNTAITPTLRFWTQSKDLLAGGSGPKNLTFEIRLQILNPKANAPNTFETIPVGVRVITVTDSAPGWDLIQTTIPFRGSFNSNNSKINKDGYLRVELNCMSSSEDDCHVAFDTTTYAALLNVDFA